MSHRSSVEIAPAQVPGIVETLLNHYRVHAEAAAQAVDRYLRGDAEGTEAIGEARARLEEAAGALEDLGWSVDARIAPGELAGSPRLMLDVLSSAVIAAADDLAEACRGYHAGTADLGAIRRAFDELVARHRLFEEHEQREAS